MSVLQNEPRRNRSGVVGPCGWRRTWCSRCAQSPWCPWRAKSSWRTLGSKGTRRTSELKHTKALRVRFGSRADAQEEAARTGCERKTRLNVRAKKKGARYRCALEVVELLAITANPSSFTALSAVVGTCSCSRHASNVDYLLRRRCARTPLPVGNSGQKKERRKRAVSSVCSCVFVCLGA